MEINFLPCFLPSDDIAYCVFRGELLENDTQYATRNTGKWGSYFIHNPKHLKKNIKLESGLGCAQE